MTNLFLPWFASLKVLRKGRGLVVPHVVGAMRGVSKLRGLEEGGPHVEGILRGSQNVGTWVLR